MEKADKKNVVHDVGVWLSRTKTWLYSEVKEIGAPWESWVVANRTANLAEFPIGNLFAVRERYGTIRWFIEMALFRMGIVRQCPSISRFVKALRPGILHSHFGPTGWRNLPLAEAVGAKHVVSFYGNDVTMTPRNPPWRKRYRDLFAKADAVLCEGPYMAASLERLECPAEKIHLYHLGVNLNTISYRKPAWRPGQPLRILMAATFMEKKGLPYAFDALARFQQIRPEVLLQVTVVGGANKSRETRDQLAAILRIIEENNMKDIVAMKGFCPHRELIQLAREHDIFLSPSLVAGSGDCEGGAPVAIIEMAAAGLVVVSTRHCDIPYVLGSSNRDLLVPERNSAALADVLARLCTTGIDWAVMTRANRERIEQEFNLRNQGPELARIYSSLVT